QEVERRVGRPLSERFLRRLLRIVLTNPGLFRIALKLGRWFQPLLPDSLQRKVPVRGSPAERWPQIPHPRKMLILDGCVQSSLSPNTNAAAARVLDRLGIEVSRVPAAKCCGAIDYHLDAHAAGLAHARRNIDAWWPAVQDGAEAIVQTASGCG